MKVEIGTEIDHLVMVINEAVEPFQEIVSEKFEWVRGDARHLQIHRDVRDQVVSQFYFWKNHDFGFSILTSIAVPQFGTCLIHLVLGCGAMIQQDGVFVAGIKHHPVGEGFVCLDELYRNVRHAMDHPHRQFAESEG